LHAFRWRQWQPRKQDHAPHTLARTMLRRVSATGHRLRPMPALLARPASLVQQRGLADAPAKAAPVKGAAATKKKGKEDKKQAGPVELRNHKVGEKIPIAVDKQVGDPVVKPDDAYPSWLGKITKLPTLSELERVRAQRPKVLAAASTAPVTKTPEELALDQRYWRLKRRDKIRSSNSSSLIF
jgi:hypothetical protein